MHVAHDLRYDGAMKIRPGETSAVTRAQSEELKGIADELEVGAKLLARLTKEADGKHTPRLVAAERHVDELVTAFTMLAADTTLTSRSELRDARTASSRLNAADFAVIRAKGEVAQRRVPADALKWDTDAPPDGKPSRHNESRSEHIERMAEHAKATNTTMVLQWNGQAFIAKPGMSAAQIEAETQAAHAPSAAQEALTKLNLGFARESYGAEKDFPAKLRIRSTERIFADLNARSDDIVRDAVGQLKLPQEIERFVGAVFAEPPAAYLEKRTLTEAREVLADNLQFLIGLGSLSGEARDAWKAGIAAGLKAS